MKAFLTSKILTNLAKINGPLANLEFTPRKRNVQGKNVLTTGRCDLTRNAKRQSLTLTLPCVFKASIITEKFFDAFMLKV